MHENFVKDNTLIIIKRIKFFMRKSPARMAIILGALLLAFTLVINPGSLNINTFSSILMLTLLLSFASAGQTMVLIGGGMDFSVGVVMSTAAIITTGVMQGENGHILPTLALVLLMGGTIGFFNGICCTKIDLPPMIVTMAISSVITRLDYVFTSGSAYGYPSPLLIQSITYRIFGIIPMITLYGLLFMPLMFFLLSRSRFGNQVYLMGNNPKAAALNGVNVNKVKVLTYVFSGLLSAFTGMLAAAYIGMARCQIFDNYAYQSLVAVIVGGTSFSGGIGTFTGSVAGAFLMTTLSNTLTVMQFSPPVRNIVTGVVLSLLLLLYNRSKSVRQ